SADTRDDRVQIADRFSPKVNGWTHGRDTHVTTLVVNDAHFVAELFTGLHQARGRVNPGAGGEYADPHGNPFDRSLWRARRAPWSVRGTRNGSEAKAERECIEEEERGFGRAATMYRARLNHLL